MMKYLVAPVLASALMIGCGDDKCETKMLTARDALNAKIELLNDKNAKLVSAEDVDTFSKEYKLKGLTCEETVKVNGKDETKTVDGDKLVADFKAAIVTNAKRPVAVVAYGN